MTASYEAVERAVADVPGVAGATVAVSEDSGRSRLRIRLEPDQDADAVSRAVSQVLRDQFGIAVDPADIRPRPPQPEHGVPAPPAASPNGQAGDAVAAGVDDATPATAPPDAAQATSPAPLAAGAAAKAAARGADTAARLRVVLSDLTTESHGLESRAQVLLQLWGRTARGSATSVALRTATLRAVAEATLAAVEQLCGGGVRTAVEHIEIAPDDDHVTVVIAMLTHTGPDHLLGTSLVRDDLDRAVARATLDAVNRRTQPLLSLAT